MPLHSLKSSVYCTLVTFFIFLLGSCSPEKTYPESNANINFSKLSGSEKVEKTIILSNGNVAITGSIHKNGFIAVFNTDGDVLWFEEIGGLESDELFDIIETTDGNLLAVGKTASPSEGVVNLNFTDGWLVNYSATGKLNWKRVIGDVKLNEALLSVKETPKGDFILAGASTVGIHYTYVAKVSKDGTSVLWEFGQRFGPLSSLAKSIVFDPNGNIVIAGLCTNSIGIGNLYVSYIAQINVNNGSIQGFAMFNDYLRQSQYTNNLIYGGALILNNEVDGFSWTTFIEGPELSGTVQFAKIDFNANILLEKRYSGIGNMDLKTAIKAENGGYIICGETSKDAFDALAAGVLKNSQSTLLKIDNQGEVIWTSTYGTNFSAQSALAAKFENNGWTIYASNRDPETSSLSYYKYTTDNLGIVIQ
jgi:hypothetical protein